MRKFYIFFVVVIITASCCPCKKISDNKNTSIVVRDSFIVELDTVAVELPVERLVNVTRDTISILKTSAAVSVASVTDGILKHSIENTGSVNVVRPIVRHTRDSVFIEKKTTVGKMTNELNCFQKFKYRAFWPLTAIVVLLSIILFLK